jgi:glyoxylase-like metal-dependent hydrolase (beta-lactamase superfamily II)
MPDDVHEVYAIRYAHHDRRSSENFLRGDPHDVLQPLAYFVWAVVGPHGTFVVDTGFDRQMADKRGRVLLKPIADGLKAIDIAADAVEHVIVTHLHYDHCGNHGLFPRARYHLQEIEMAYATGRSMCHAEMRVPFEVDDVAAMVRKVFDQRVVFHDRTGQIAPGITVHHIGGHSKGLQCVRVRTRRGHVVLASDASHLYAHFTEGRVFPVTYSVADTLEGYATLRALAESPDHVVPGHDPQVLERYPAAAPALENWIVRLDVDPLDPARSASPSGAPSGPRSS